VSAAPKTRSSSMHEMWCMHSITAMQAPAAAQLTPSSLNIL